MKLNSTARNILIVLVLAAVAAAAGGVDRAVVFQFVSLLFLAAIGWVASRLYREHRVALYSLGDRRRAILYVALGVGTLTLSASRLTSSPGGTVVWLLLLAGALFAIYTIFRSSREY